MMQPDTLTLRQRMHLLKATDLTLQLCSNSKWQSS